MIAEEDLLPYLRDRNYDVQLRGLRALKNSVIGHNEQKAAYVERGVLDDLLNILNSSCSGPLNDYEDCRIEAAVVLGSFAYSESEIASRMFTSKTLTTLINLLNETSSQQLLLASLRTLSTLLSSNPPITSLVIIYANLPESLSNLLTTYTAQYVQKRQIVTSQILYYICKLVPLISPNYGTVNIVSKVLTAPLLSFVQELIVTQPKVAMSTIDNKLQSCAILALAHVLTPSSTRSLLKSSPEFTNALLVMLRGSDTSIKLSAASLLTVLFTSNTGATNAASKGMKSNQVPNNALAIFLVPALMKLLDDALSSGEDVVKRCDPKILHTLAVVCRDGGDVTDRCVEAGLIKKIVSIIVHVAPNNHFKGSWGKETNMKFLSGGLMCLAALGLHKDEYRKMIINAGSLGVVMAVMNMPNTPAVREVKIAACHVLRTLSRSVVLLRTTLVESGVVGGVVDLLGESPMSEDTKSHAILLGTEPLAENFSIDKDSVNLKLIDGPEVEEDLEVRTAAMAAVCNLVLEFSPLRKPILDKGILPLIAAGAKSRYAPLRLNSVWALKHLVYGDDMDTRTLVVSQIGFPLLVNLCRDSEPQVQEQALAFVRNLTCRSEKFIDKLFENVGVDEMFRVIEEKLAVNPVALNAEAEDASETLIPDSESGTPLLSTSPYYGEIVVAALYILVHIAASVDRHREAVLCRQSLLEKVVQLMHHERDEIRLACVWMVLNLTSTEDRNYSASLIDEDLSSIREGETSGGGIVHDESNRQSDESSPHIELHFADMYRRRASTLIRLGFRDKLEVLKQDRALDVREKTKLAIYNIDWLVGFGDDSNNDSYNSNFENTIISSTENGMDLDTENREN
ncbi:armadillo-type protein [Dipodascopsis uninucleata]